MKPPREVAVIDPVEADRLIMEALLQQLGLSARGFQSGVEYIAWNAACVPGCLVVSWEPPVGGGEPPAADRAD